MVMTFLIAAIAFCAFAYNGNWLCAGICVVLGVLSTAFLWIIKMDPAEEHTFTPEQKAEGNRLWALKIARESVHKRMIVDTPLVQIVQVTHLHYDDRQDRRVARISFVGYVRLSSKLSRFIDAYRRDFDRAEELDDPRRFLDDSSTYNKWLAISTSGSVQEESAFYQLNHLKERIAWLCGIIIEIDEYRTKVYPGQRLAKKQNQAMLSASL